MNQIYLDNNSTTPIDPSVAKAIQACYHAAYVNPASQHRMGQASRRKLEELRSEIVLMLGGRRSGMSPDRLIFTSGGTESNNLAILGSAHQPSGALPITSRRVLVSAIEHPSVSGAADQLARHGFEIHRIPVDRNGVIRLDEFESLISKPTRLVSIMLANNETGVLQPVQQASEMCRQRSILFHTDAVQAVGKINVNFSELGVDAMTFTAHKFHGPRGIGGLLVRDGVTPAALVFGGFQQMAIRPGTEDVALAAGLHQALTLFRDSGNQRTARMRQLRDRLESIICQACAGVVSNGAAANRVPHTLNLSLPGIDRQAFLMAADLAGLAISTGSACASGSSDPSPVLVAMGASDGVIQGSIRISLGAQTTAEEIDTASARIIKLIHELGGQKSS